MENINLKKAVCLSSLVYMASSIDNVEVTSDSLVQKTFFYNHDQHSEDGFQCTENEIRDNIEKLSTGFLEAKSLPETDYYDGFDYQQFPECGVPRLILTCVTKINKNGDMDTNNRACISEKSVDVSQSQHAVGLQVWQRIVKIPVSAKEFFQYVSNVCFAKIPLKRDPECFNSVGANKWKRSPEIMREVEEVILGNINSNNEL